MNKQLSCCSFRLKWIGLKRTLSIFEKVLRIVLLLFQIWTLYLGF